MTAQKRLEAISDHSAEFYNIFCGGCSVNQTIPFGKYILFKRNIEFAQFQMRMTKKIRLSPVSGEFRLVTYSGWVVCQPAVCELCKSLWTYADWQLTSGMNGLEPVNDRRRNNAGLMLGQCRKRWANIEPTFELIYSTTWASQTGSVQPTLDVDPMLF